MFDKIKLLMQKRNIKKVTVLGSGVMGSRIACHFAGIGLQVLLLDIAPKDAESPKDRNKIVNDALSAAAAKHARPELIPLESFARTPT